MSFPEFPYSRILELIFQNSYPNCQRLKTPTQTQTQTQTMKVRQLRLTKLAVPVTPDSLLDNQLELELEDLDRLL